MRQLESVSPYESADPETKRVWWSDAGVHQDITFPVHPDPISGMHCWHQMVRVEKPRRTIGLEIFLSIRIFPSRFIRDGRHWRVRLRGREVCGGRSALPGWCGGRKRRSALT